MKDEQAKDLLKKILEPDSQKRLKYFGNEEIVFRSMLKSDAYFNESLTDTLCLLFNENKQDVIKIINEKTQDIIGAAYESIDINIPTCFVLLD